jgi:phosphate transport system substrate-binding protein
VPNQSWKKFTRLRVVALALGASALTAGVAFADPVRLLESGSSLLYPVFNLWVSEYGKAHPDVQIVPQAGGSGQGIAQSIAGIVQIGGSDAYLSDNQMTQNPGMLNIPLAISSQTVDFNIPGWPAGKRMVLSGPVLAGIYMGAIKTWNDPAIAALNPGAPLPANPIVTIHRAEGSGDTFLFTQFLTTAAPSVWTLHYGSTVNWPALPGATGANGNAGMVSTAKTVPYSIIYVGISYRSQAGAAGLHEAALVNQAGKAVVSSPATVLAAVGATVAKTPADERVSLIFGPGANSYPIINYEYAIVKQAQPSPDVAAALKTFLNWAISPAGGNAPATLSQAQFTPLPAAIRTMSGNQINSIH